MKKRKVNVSFDKSENDFVLSWKDKYGGVYLITIESDNNTDIMVSFSSNKINEGWREFIELKNNEN